MQYILIDYRELIGFGYCFDYSGGVPVYSGQLNGASARE
jgi:hypothetical protein